MKKTYSIKNIRKSLIEYDFIKSYGTYPEWTEWGVSTWDHIPEDGLVSISVKDLEKLIDEGLLVYCMIDDRFIPSQILDGQTQEWLI